MKKLFTVLCGIALFATPAFAFAATDYFLKIDGVEGESTDNTHPKEIQVDSWSWGMSNSGTTHTGGGAGAGKVSAQDLSFTKRFDKSSPKLMEKCASGEHMKEVKLTVRTSTGRMSDDYLVYTLNEVMCSSYQVSSSDGRPTENLSLNFAKMKVEYKPQSLGGDVIRAILDFVDNIFN